MERLTKYDEFGNAELVGIDNTKLYERLVCDETVALTTAIDKLGKLEDALEEFELTSAEDLRNHLNFQDNMAIWEGELNYKNKIVDLEQQLAKLKQKAIVPKFVVGQEIWDKYLMAWKIKRVETHQFDKGNGNTAIIEIYRLGLDGNDDYNCCILPYDNDIFFATKEEAEQKLAEIGGKDD